MNEYGSIQQHLEPSHVRDMLIPVPQDWSDVSDLIEKGKQFILAKEASDSAVSSLMEKGFDYFIEPSSANQ